MQTVELKEAQAKLSELVKSLNPGDEIVIEKNHKPVARLLPTATADTSRKPRSLREFAGKFRPLSQTEQDDAQLVKASQHGDQDAFAFLVKGHQRRVFNMVLRMLQNDEEASEITQEAFLDPTGGVFRLSRPSKGRRNRPPVSRDECQAPGTP